MADDPRMAEDAQEVERLKRRLRKKLRQIENLELLERDLNWEELDKVQVNHLGSWQITFRFRCEGKLRSENNLRYWCKVQRKKKKRR